MMVASQKNVESWDLSSGKWVRSEGEKGYRLLSTVNGREAVSAQGVQGLARLVGGRVLGSDIFPSEFLYDTQTGAELPRPVCTITEMPLWVPPFGSQSVDLEQGASQPPRGLRVINDRNLQLTKPKTRSKSDGGEFKLILPEPGYLHFMVIHAGVPAPHLVALDLQNGALRLWQRSVSGAIEAGTWETFRHDSNGLLAECPEVLKEYWRCELVESEKVSSLFIATEKGLACVKPDILTMSYSASYFGQGAACGLPMYWNEKVWLPVHDAKGAVSLCGVHPESFVVESLNVSGLPVGVNFIASPVCKDGLVIWIGELGQLILKKTTDGKLDAHFALWPDDFKPVLECGSPYMCNKGKFWQLCLSGAKGRHAYVALGLANETPELSTSPRGCTGKVSYRFAQQLKDAPWQDPEHVEDASQNHVVFPLIEFRSGSPSGTTIVGVRVDNDPEGVLKILRSPDKLHAVLITESDETVSFFGFRASRPWSGSLFIYDSKLWFHHPELPHIAGWSLA